MFKNLVLDQENMSTSNIGNCFYAFVGNSRPFTELDAAALTIQKFYKSYRTRRNLADCAVVVEELWFVNYILSNTLITSCYLKYNE